MFVQRSILEQSTKNHPVIRVHVSTNVLSSKVLLLHLSVFFIFSSLIKVFIQKFCNACWLYSCNYTLVAKIKDSEPAGNIVFDYEGKIQNIPYYHKDIADMREAPKYGDKVSLSSHPVVPGLRSSPRPSRYRQQKPCMIFSCRWIAISIKGGFFIGSFDCFDIWCAEI